MAPNTHSIPLRIRRERAVITAMEQELIKARDHGNEGEVARLERDLKARWAYLDDLQGTARLMPRP